MKQYFVIADIHGFYTAMIKSLHKAGFRKSNPNHILIVCGDIFDRGNESPKVYEFLRSLPKKRRILIRGNHEYLLRDLVTRGYPYDYDAHNGTLGTINSFVETIAPITPEVHVSFHDRCTLFKELGVLDWIFSDEWVNYYELGKYIFVHSWIPVDTHSHLPLYYIGSYHRFTMMEDWRNASDYWWEEATWGCPIKMYLADLIPEGKTIVCGHWRVSDFHAIFNQEEQINNNIYISERLIGLDATTASSGFCNVFSFTM